MSFHKRSEVIHDKDTPDQAGQALEKVFGRALASKFRHPVDDPWRCRLKETFEVGRFALKHSITLLNTPGTIDAGYRGEISVIMINHGKEDFHIEPGMRIAQMVITPILKATLKEVSHLSDSLRGKGGFGSTGDK